MKLNLHILNNSNRQRLLNIKRDDIPFDFVQDVKEIIQLTEYGDKHQLRGHCYTIKCDDDYVGIILIGEGIESERDPDEIKGIFFYRILGFVIDKDFRGLGIGSWAIEQSIQNIYAEYGVAPIVIECHKNNIKAIKFYENHHFRNTYVIENENYYMIRDN